MVWLRWSGYYIGSDVVFRVLRRLPAVVWILRRLPAVVLILRWLHCGGEGTTMVVGLQW